MLLVTWSSLVLMAASQSAAPAASQPAPKAKASECRIERELGSRIPRKICRPAAEWERISAEAQEEMNRNLNQRHLPPAQ